eukprot:3912549-Prorocentrum_lima.AAC.1
MRAAARSRIARRRCSHVNVMRCCRREQRSSAEWGQQEGGAKARWWKRQRCTSVPPPPTPTFCVHISCTWSLLAPGRHIN